MDIAYSKQDLREAQVTFVLASQMVYAEPELVWITSLVKNKVFDEAPYGAKNASVALGLDLLRTWVSQAQKRGFEEALSDLRSEWLMVLAGVGTPEAPCWESCYSETNKQLFGDTALEVRKWYKRYGLMLENQNKEPDDHLGIMLGFVGHLIGLEAEALVDNHPQASNSLEKAQEDFMVEHILPWLSAWHYLLKKHARSDYYRGVASLVFGLCEEYVGRFGIEYNPESERFLYTKEESLLV